MDKRHLLICGERGAGKSTLIRRLLAETSLSVTGFVTKRESIADEKGFYPVYIHPAAQPEGERRYEKENLVGLCDSCSSIRFPQAFETLGLTYLRAGVGDVLVMDELGFLETDASAFRAVVLCALESDVPVIAAVKEKKTGFLDAVRASEKAWGVDITPENRDALYEELLPFVYAWEE